MNYYKIEHNNNSVYIQSRLDNGEIHDVIVFTDKKYQELKEPLSLIKVLNAIVTKDRDTSLFELTTVRF